MKPNHYRLYRELKLKDNIGMKLVNLKINKIESKAVYEWCIEVLITCICCFESEFSWNNSS